MFQPVPPVGVADSIDYKGKAYTFDCMGGTGDPIYQHVKDSGERFHVIVVNREGTSGRGQHPGPDVLPRRVRRNHAE